MCAECERLLGDLTRAEVAYRNAVAAITKNWKAGRPEFERLDAAAEKAHLERDYARLILEKHQLSHRGGS